MLVCVYSSSENPPQNNMFGHKSLCTFPNHLLIFKMYVATHLGGGGGGHREPKISLCCQGVVIQEEEVVNPLFVRADKQRKTPHPRVCSGLDHSCTECNLEK